MDLREGPEGLGVAERLGKDRVGARLDIEARPGDCPIQSLTVGRVRARHDVEVTARLDGGGDLGRHLVRADKLLVVEVAAFLRQPLVLDLHGGGAGILEGPHHLHDVQGLAEAGVAVDEDGELRGARHLPHVEAHFVEGEDAEVGQPHGG